MANLRSKAIDSGYTNVDEFVKILDEEQQKEYDEAKKSIATYEEDTSFLEHNDEIMEDKKRERSEARIAEKDKVVVPFKSKNKNNLDEKRRERSDARMAEKDKVVVPFTSKNDQTSSLKNNGSKQNVTSVKHNPYSQILWNNDAKVFFNEKQKWPPQDFSFWGCGICTAAEIITNLTDQSISPVQIMDTYDQNGLSIIQNKANGVFTVPAQSYGCKSEVLSDVNNDSKEKILTETIDNGGNAAIAVSGGGHWVAVVGYHKDENGTTVYSVMDPYNKPKNGIIEEPYKDYTLEELNSYVIPDGISYKQGFSTIVTVVPDDKRKTIQV